MKLVAAALSALWCGVMASVALAQPVASVVLDTPQQVINQHVEVLTTPFELQPLATEAAQLTRIVFYRHPSQAQQPKAVAVFVRNQLHTALVPGGYSPLCLPAAALDIRLRQAQREASATLSTQPGATQYITFNEADGLLAIRTVGEAQALAQLADLRLQAHAISRVSAAQPCVDSAPAQTSAPAAKP